MAGEGDHITGGDLYAVSFITWTIFYEVLSVVNCAKVWSFSFELHSWVFISLQTVFENSLMQHHVALPPDAMGKVTFVAPSGQYSLKVSLWLLYLLFRFPFLGPSLSTCNAISWVCLNISMYPYVNLIQGFMFIMSFTWYILNYGLTATRQWNWFLHENMEYKEN